MVAWLNLNGADRLTHGLICKVQKVITLHQPDLRPRERGFYRDMAQVDVRIGSYHPPTHALIPSLMENWLLDHESLGLWRAHVRFEKIHPFVDGNGRTGRMLMWWQEIRAGEEPTLLKAADRVFYYRRLAK